MRRAFALVVTAALAACGGPPSGPPPLRLLELAPDARLDGPPAPPAVFARPATIGSGGDRGLFGAVRRAAGEDFDTRAAFVLPTGSTLAWPLDLPSRAELRVGLAPLATAPTGPATVHFLATLTRSGRPPVTLLDRELPVSPAGGWVEVAAPIERGGAGATLELAVAGHAGLAGAWSAPEIVPRGARPARPSLILVSLDTLRADRLGAYGYRERPTSPRLDAFAARGVRFDVAVAQAPWTRPSHRSLLSGLYPASNRGLAPEPLARQLWRAGYRTWAVTEGGQIDSRFGFDDGFESYADARHWLRRPEPPLERLWRERDRSSFLFLHTYEPHDPYTDRRFVGERPCDRVGEAFEADDWLRLKRGMRGREKQCVGALYDGDVAYTDERIGALLDRLAGAGALDDTIVVVTSDHGEELWDHDQWGHGRTMYDELLRVPLLVHLPPALRRQLAVRGSPLVASGRTAAVGEPVALVDLVPSLLELVGVPLEGRVHGRSFVPLLRGEALPERQIFAENVNRTHIERKALRSRNWKFVRTYPRRGAPLPAGAGLELFDLREDPHEQRNLAGRHPEAVERLAAELEAITGGRLGHLDRAIPIDADRELQQQLRALGYLDH